MPAPGPARQRTNSQTQLDQQPDFPLSEAPIAAAAGLARVEIGASNWAPKGTVGFHLTPAAAEGPPDALLLGREFAHVHPDPVVDGIAIDGGGRLYVAQPDGLVVYDVERPGEAGALCVIAIDGSHVSNVAVGPDAVLMIATDRVFLVPFRP